MATKKIQTTSSNALARPSFIAAGDTRGREAVEQGDLTLPRLAIAQPQSPQIDEGNVKEIEGLKAGEAFNTLTGAIYGKAVDVIIIRHESPRFMELIPVDEGGGVKDFNVSADDPRTQFGEDGSKPIATKFLDSIAMLPGTMEPIALSFKSAGLKCARDLRGLGATLNAASFAAIFTLTTVKKTGDKGTYHVFTPRLKGWVDEETFAAAGVFHESIKDRVVETTREGAAPEASPADDAPF